MRVTLLVAAWIAVLAIFVTAGNEPIRNTTEALAATGLSLFYIGLLIASHLEARRPAVERPPWQNRPSKSIQDMVRKGHGCGGVEGHAGD